MTDWIAMFAAPRRAQEKRSALKLRKLKDYGLSKDRSSHYLLGLRVEEVHLYITITLSRVITR